jgi:LL-diaminopimelate aminotransferase
MDQPGADRIHTLPPYLFADIDQRVKAAQARGVDVINLGIGDPDLPTPEPVVAARQRAAAVREWQRYPDYLGLPSFREAVAAYYARRFGVALDPAREVMALIGSKEGIAHLTWALVGPTDAVLAPDPGYPVYAVQARLAGAEAVALPLSAGRFWPQWEAVDAATWRRARLLWINYPNNPTGAVATRGLYQTAVAQCRRHGVALASDLAYADVGFEGYRAPSVLETPGARDVAVEFFSLSKPYRMTGWRIAAAVGNAALLGALAALKTHTDSGPFTAVQVAASRALAPDLDAEVRAGADVYRRRRDRTVAALGRVGLRPASPRATFYLWVPAPDGMDGRQAADLLLDRAAVVVTPGVAFGDGGRGYFRISLTQPDARLDEALQRMERALSF